MPRRVSRPRPQTQRCRYGEGGVRCPSIATRGGFCLVHERQLEDDLAEPAPSPLVDLVRGLFGVGSVSPKRVREAGAQVVTEALRGRFPGSFPFGEGFSNPPPPGAARPQAQRVHPEAIRRRKENLAARGVLGFESDEVLTAEMIRKRRQELARVYHTDGQAPDPTRETMMRRINTAHDLLMAASKPPAPR